MKVCPVDFGACCDDICHGARCLQAGGEDMIEIWKCPGCGKQASDDEDISQCVCPPPDDYPED